MKIRSKAVSTMHPSLRPALAQLNNQSRFPAVRSPDQGLNRQDPLKLSLSHPERHSDLPTARSLKMDEGLRNTLADLGRRHRDSQGRYRGTLWELAAATAAIARALESDDDLFRQFRELAEWERYQPKFRPAKKDAKRIVWFLYRLHAGPENMDRREVHERASAVDYLLRTGIEPSAVTSELQRRGGFLGVNKERRGLAKPKSSAAEKHVKYKLECPTDETESNIRIALKSIPNLTVKVREGHCKIVVKSPRTAESTHLASPYLFLFIGVRLLQYSDRSPEQQ